jgi:hypothetical protein
MECCGIIEYIVVTTLCSVMSANGFRLRELSNWRGVTKRIDFGGLCSCTRIDSEERGFATQVRSDFRKVHVFIVLVTFHSLLSFGPLGG